MYPVQVKLYQIKKNELNNIMVVSSVLHGSAVRGIDNGLTSVTYNNRAVFLNNRNINQISSVSVTSTTSASFLSNGFYYGLTNSTKYSGYAGKFISINKKNTKNKKKKIYEEQFKHGS